MYRLIIDLEDAPIEVALAPDFNINMLLNNSLIGTKQSGSFVFPFRIPISRDIQVKFGFPELPSATTDRKKTFSAIMLNGSLELFRGFINLRKANHTGYDVDLTKTPGNIKKNIWEQKLSEIDFGQDTLQSTLTTANFYYVNFDNYNYTKNTIPYLPYDWQSIFAAGEQIKIQKVLERCSPKIKIFVNDVQVSSYYITYNTLFFSTYKEFVDNTIPDWIMSFDDTLYQSTIKLEQILTNKSIFCLKILDPATVISSVRFEIHYDTNPINDFSVLVDSYNMTRLQYQDVSNALNTINNKPYQFIPYTNDQFYDTTLNEAYSGIVNERKDGNLVLNTYISPSAHAISPCFQLKFIFEKLVEKIGYTLNYSTTIWDNVRSSMYLFSNVALDKQLELLSDLIPFNIYGDLIKYQYFMPDWTVREFFDSIRILFGVSLDFNDLQHTLTVKSFKDIINANEVIDIAEKVIFAPICNINDPTYYQLVFANAEQTNEVLLHFPTDAVVSASSITYNKLETKLRPGVFITDTDTTQTEKGLMVLNAKAKSKLFKQYDERPEPVMMFVQNGVADNVSDTLNLRWGGEKGFFLNHLKEYIEFLNSTIQFETEVKFFEQDLYNLKFDQKYYAYGITFLAESLSIKLPIRTTSTLKLLSLNIVQNAIQE